MQEQSKSRKKPGRPPLDKPRNICVTISLPPELHAGLKELGGSPWVQKQIRDALTKNIKPTQENNK